eukprot:773122_1
MLHTHILFAQPTLFHVGSNMNGKTIPTTAHHLSTPSLATISIATFIPISSIFPYNMQHSSITLMCIPCFVNAVERPTIGCTNHHLTSFPPTISKRSTGKLCMEQLKGSALLR